MVAQAVAYAPAFVVLGVNILDEEKSRAVLTAFGRGRRLADSR